MISFMTVTRPTFRTADFIHIYILYIHLFLCIYILILFLSLSNAVVKASIHFYSNPTRLHNY